MNTGQLNIRNIPATIVQSFRSQALNYVTLKGLSDAGAAALMMFSEASADEQAMAIQRVRVLKVENETAQKLAARKSKSRDAPHTRGRASA